MAEVGSLLAGVAGGGAIAITIVAVDKYSSVFKNVNKAMLATGVAVTALGVAGLAASKSFINTAASFESAFTGVRKTVDLTEEEFSKLRQTFKDLSKEIPVSFIELSKIGEIAGQLGVNGVANIEKFTRTIADIAVTTNLTAEAAATSFARIANIMQEPIENVDKMGAVVVDLGNNFATTEAEISVFANRIAGAGNIAGLTTSQILAIGAAFSSVGVQAESGGTAVQKVLIGINTAVVTGNDKLETFAETAGLSADEFALQWNLNAGKAFELFVTGLGKQGDQAITTLETLELKDQRLVRAFLSLSNAGDLVTDTFNTANKAWEENNALVEEAEKRYATTDSQVTILRNKFDSLKDQMGQTLIPAFINLVDILGKVIGLLEKHPTLTKFAVAAIAIGGAIGVIVGPLLILVAALPLLIAGFTGLSLALAPILIGILPILGAIIGMVAAIKLFNKLTQKSRDRQKLADQEEFDRLNPSIAKKTNTINLSPSVPSNSINLSRQSQPGTINLTIQGDVVGTDPDDMAEAFAEKMDKVIRL